MIFYDGFNFVDSCDLARAKLKKEKDVVFSVF